MVRRRATPKRPTRGPAAPHPSRGGSTSVSFRVVKPRWRPTAKAEAGRPRFRHCRGDRLVRWVLARRAWVAEPTRPLCHEPPGRNGRAVSVSGAAHRKGRARFPERGQVWEETSKYAGPKPGAATIGAGAALDNPTA